MYELQGTVPAGIVVPVYGPHLRMQATEGCTSRRPVRLRFALFSAVAMTGRLRSPDEMKRALRLQAQDARRDAHARLRRTAGVHIAEAFLAAVAWRPGQVVAGYWPIGDEVDDRPLLERLSRLGCIAALPVVLRKHAALAFRRWAPGDPLEAGPHGTRHPSVAASEVVPDLLLVPLLGFDRRGARLGYGGGYYDRSLESLRARRSVSAVGLGYAAQEFASLPCEGHDQRLDWIVTENGAWEALP